MKKNNSKLIEPVYCKLKDSALVYVLKEIKENIAVLILNSKVLNVNKNDIEIVHGYKKKKEALQESSFKYIPADNAEVSNEIMLRLMTADEAMPLLDKFIDSAVIAGLPSVKIIHGKKGGVIRRVVHEYLDNSAYIESYTYAQYWDGSYGATVAKLKSRNTFDKK